MFVPVKNQLRGGGCADLYPFNTSDESDYIEQQLLREQDEYRPGEAAMWKRSAESGSWQRAA